MKSVNHQAAVKKLKKQLTVLKRKEALAAAKLKRALTQVTKLGKSYERKLASTLVVMKGRMVKSEAAAYLKAALLERQLLKSVEQKARAVAAAAAMIEKKYAVKLVRGAEKSVPVKKPRKVVKGGRAKTKTHKK